MENKQQQLNEIFQQCRTAGVCHTQSEFAELIGVNRSGMSAAMNGNPLYLSDNLMSKVKAFASAHLAQDGKGGVGYTIPIFPNASRGGSLCDVNDGHTEQECERIVSPIKGATMAMYVYGDSMEPEYPSGSLILLKKINPNMFVEWGCVYVLDTENGAICKKISKGHNEDYVLCESINERYQSFEVRLDAIRGWWRVLMNMSMK